jgi:epoxide hydrolase-like predicted phosphatase
MIKAIVFDVGGVLTKENMLEHYSKLAEITGYNIKKFYKIRKRYINQAVIGKISAIEYIKLFTKELGIKDFKKFKQNWIKIRSKCIIVDKDVEKIIKKLKNKKYKVGSLTNILPLHQKLRNKKNIYKIFDFNICSCEVGLSKPDIKIYKLLIKKLELPPKEIVFVDDVRECLIPARKLGINTILFKNNKQLIRDLRRLDVRV